MRTYLAILLVLVGAVQGQAADATHLVLKRLEQGINRRALTALLGPVDVDFAYTLNPAARTVALLELGPEQPIAEKEEAPVPVVPRDSLDVVVSATHTAAGARLAAGSGVCCGDPGTVRRLDPVTGDSVWVPVEAKPQAEFEAPRPEIPADLAAADLDALKAQLTSPNVRDGKTAYLAVHKVVVDPRRTGRRLSLAEEELTLMERRLLRWDARQIYGNWPAAAMLSLTSTQKDMEGDEGTLPVTWELRRPAAPGTLQVVASGELDLDFRRVDGQWVVSGIQHLVHALHRAVVPDGVAIASEAARR